MCRIRILLLFSGFVVASQGVQMYGPPKQATIGERPFHVAILKDEFFVCSGTLISPNCVLSACSCLRDVAFVSETVHKLQSNYTLVTNSIYLSSEQTYYGHASDAFIMPGCNTQTNENDAVVICTPTKLVGLPATAVDYETNVGVRGIVSGWGLAVTGDEALHDELQRAYMKIISLEECRRRYSGIREVPDSALCAVATNEVRGFCLGDVGGPLTHGEGIIGITVTEFGCGIVKYPGIFTNVSNIIAFIEDAVEYFDLKLRFESA